MSRQIIQKTYKPTPECIRINELAEKALSGAAEAKKRIYAAGEEALRCGHLLIAEKSKITKEMGRGYWTSYFEINHGKVFNLRTAQRWMALAEIPQLETTKSKSVVLERGAEPPPAEGDNRLRGVMVSLEIFPKKTHAAVEGDQPAIRNSSFLVIGNRFKAWYANWRKVNGDIRPTEEQLATFRADIRELIDFLDLGPIAR